MSSHIAEEDLNKALSNLESLAKSKGAGKTNSTKVESMVGESGSTQIFHTASNSDPGQWAGSRAEDVPGNGVGVDKVSDNGTDLRMSKSILAKIAKGQDLSEDEKKFVAKAMKEQEDVDKAMMPPQLQGKGKDDEGDDEDEDKKAPPFGKSLAEAAAEDPSLRHGFEVSDFLKSLVGALSTHIDGVEKRLSKSIAAVREEQIVMSKSLASGIGDVGTVVGASLRKLEAVEQGAARAPKSASAAASALNKSLGAEGQPLSKSLVGDVLETLMKSKECTPTDVLKFDATGEISRELEGKVRAYLASKG